MRSQIDSSTIAEIEYEDNYSNDVQKYIIEHIRAKNSKPLSHFRIIKNITLSQD